MKYRSEIDGLRAVAVIPVILFHAGFEIFEGGFIGVDVFFVISGYLITNIILSEMNKGKFSIITFYERRARRILPALFFVMCCCIPFAWLWFLPNHLKEFSESMAATSVFSSNIFFWSVSDYFATSTEIKPLLHTWTLAVEEQYYIVFPLFLMALWKLRKRWIFSSLVLVTIGSLVLAQWGAHHHPQAAFYLLPTRGWELAIGGLIAFYFIYKCEQSDFIISHKVINEVLGLLGLALIFYSIFSFNKSIVFPSLYTLFPTVGASLILIFSSANTIVGRLLSGKAVVGIGIVSYSAYLWHQPLFAFARYRTIGGVSATFFLILSVLSIILAYFSWRYIEVPFRDKEKVSKKKIFSFAIIGSIFFGVFGLASSHYIQEPKGEFTDGHCNTNREDCYSLKQSKLDVALWGDSIADSFAIPLGKRLNANNMSLSLYIKHSCPSIWSSLRNENKRLGERFSTACHKHNLSALNDIIQKKPKYVVLSNAYTLYMNGRNLDGEYILIDENDINLSPKSFIPNNLKEMFRIFNSYNITPIIVTPYPMNRNFFEDKKKYIFGISPDIMADYSSAKEAREILLSKISIADFEYIEINGLELFCEEADKKCSIVDKDNKILLFDGTHLTPALANKMAIKVIDKIE